MFLNRTVKILHLEGEKREPIDQTGLSSQFSAESSTFLARQEHLLEFSEQYCLCEIPLLIFPCFLSFKNKFKKKKKLSAELIFLGAPHLTTLKSYLRPPKSLCEVHAELRARGHFYKATSFNRPKRLRGSAIWSGTRNGETRDRAHERTRSRWALRLTAAAVVKFSADATPEPWP